MVEDRKGYMWNANYWLERHGMARRFNKTNYESHLDGLGRRDEKSNKNRVMSGTATHAARNETGRWELPNGGIRSALNEWEVEVAYAA